MRYGGRAGSGLLNAASGANVQTSPLNAWPRLLTSDERSIVFEHGGAISSTTERAVISDPMGSGATEILAAGGSAGLAESRATTSAAVAKPGASATLALRLDGVPMETASAVLKSIAADKLTYDVMICDRSVAEFYKRMNLPYSPSPTGGMMKMDFLEYQDYLAAQGKAYHRVLSPDETRQTGDLGWAKPGQNGGKPGHFLFWNDEPGGMNNIFTTHTSSGSRTFSLDTFGLFEKSTNRDYVYLRYVPGKK
jgi:hypothetical protein